MTGVKLALVRVARLTLALTLALGLALALEAEPPELGARHHNDAPSNVYFLPLALVW